MTKTENKAEIINKLMELKMEPTPRKEAKPPKIAEKVHSKVVINDAVLKYEDSFSNLAKKVNQHDVITYKPPDQDAIFMERLVIPNSSYWSDDRP